MFTPESITFSDLNKLSDEIIKHENNINEIPFTEDYLKLKLYTARIRDAIDLGYDMTNRGILTLSDNNQQLSILTTIYNNINEMNTTVHSYYDKINTDTLTEKNKIFINNTSVLIHEYHDQINKLEKLKIPVFPINQGTTKENTLITNIDELIKALRRQIVILESKINDAIKFGELISKINTLILMSLAIAGVWVNSVARYEPYLTGNASEGGLAEIIQEQITYFNYIAS